MSDLSDLINAGYTNTPEGTVAADEDGRPSPAESVSIAYVNSNTVCYSWHHSIVELLGWDFANNARTLSGGFVGIRHGTGGLVEARNKAIIEFLAESRADWLWWIDTDMGFAPDTVDRLFEAADPVERPMIGALCFTQREADMDGMGGWRCKATPTIFDWAKVNIWDTKTVDGETKREKVGEQQGFAVKWDYPANTLVQCAGTGAACILIHRSVFERIEEKFGQVWYDRLPNISTNQLISEDLSFCIRAGTVGFPLFVHTGVRTTHQKTLWLSEEDYWRERAVDGPPPDLEDDLGLS